MANQVICPSCGAGVGAPFYELEAVPTNSCLLINNRNAAVDFPVAPLALCLCRGCGFIFNTAWEPARTHYSEAYEETQSFSPTFNVFHDRLARDLIARHDLKGKRIVEIGCGKGEFLGLLCRLGDNEGLGYDPGFIPARQDDPEHRIRVVREFFDENSGPLACDFLCCKMTFEHIPHVGEFMHAIRQTLGSQAETGVFFQVPDAGRILREAAFWDVYYEHCSYFTADSLRGLFESSGFAVERVWTDYNEQYLMIEAHPLPESRAVATGPRELAKIEAQVDRFRLDVATAISTWRERLAATAGAGKRIVLWGSGSKAVAFLTTLGIDGEVAAVVDINPFRQGRFMPATGHPIIGPQEAAALAPDMVVIMNPVYREEIGEMLKSHACSSQLVTV